MSEREREGERGGGESGRERVKLGQDPFYDLTLLILIYLVSLSRNL